MDNTKEGCGVGKHIDPIDVHITQAKQLSEVNQCFSRELRKLEEDLEIALEKLATPKNRRANDKKHS